MTPEQAIKRHILVTESFGHLDELNESNVDEAFDEVMECYDRADILYEAMYMFRDGDEETDVPCDYCRHYERVNQLRLN